MTLFFLYLLATTDCSLCAYRVAAGRCALIEKGSYYRAALKKGIIFAQVGCAISGAILLAMLLVTTEKQALVDDLIQASNRMLTVYVTYAGLVLGTLALRLIPSTDVRAATSVMILGPMTALRPVVEIAGVLYGVLPATLSQTRWLGGSILVLMFTVQWMLERHYSRLAELEILQAADEKKAPFRVPAAGSH